MVIDGLGIKFAFYFSFPHWSVVSVTFPLPSCGLVEHFLDSMLMCLWVCLCRFGSGRSRDHTQCRDLSHDARLGLSGSAGVRTPVLALGSSPFPGEAGVTALAQNSVSGGWDTQWAGPQMRVTRAPWGKGDTGWAAGREACTVDGAVPALPGLENALFSRQGWLPTIPLSSAASSRRHWAPLTRWDASVTGAYSTLYFLVACDPRHHMGRKIFLLSFYL